MLIITSQGIESSRSLAAGLNEAGVPCKVIDVRKQQAFAHKSEVVFSYGSSVHTAGHRKRYNRSKAVETCVDKGKTFQAFKRAKIPTVKNTTSRNEASNWDIVVVRESASGRKNEGMDYWYKCDNVPLPRAELYTEYFHHSWEYRVVVFLDQVFIYHKHSKNGEWALNLRKKSQWLYVHKQMEVYALAASKSIGIDYVGFDVIVNKKGEVKFLEANSCPILCPELKDAIIKHFASKK